MMGATLQPAWSAGRRHESRFGAGSSRTCLAQGKRRPFPLAVQAERQVNKIRPVSSAVQRQREIEHALSGSL
jgi:hypothetical protein